jgi:hypothetical protein
MSTFKLVPADPVPSDIEVSQSITPLNIATIAANAGILPDEIPMVRTAGAVEPRQ